MSSSAGAGTIVVHGPRDRPRFALTFDDGPGAGTAPALELLERRGAKATFFLVGREVERRPELGRALRGRDRAAARRSPRPACEL